MKPKDSFITKFLKRPTMEQDAAAGQPEMTHQGLEREKPSKIWILVRRGLTCFV